jgi:ADP-heptose:LPS heptosyltransferase
MTFVITLEGGIGNIIQTIPFMLWLKENGHNVVARMGVHAFSKEICEMTSPSYHYLIEHNDVIPRDAIYKGNIMASEEGKQLVSRMPEWKAWFEFHGFNAPDEGIMKLDFDKSETPSKVVLAPCCKPNWPMKRYPYWNDLIKSIPNCAVVGLPTDGNLAGDFVDLRGKTSLRKLAGILEGADYVIAEEGGVAHLACAVGTKTYILYGGTDPVKNSTPANSIQIISSDVFSCRPCQAKGAWHTEGTGLSRTFYGCKKSEMINGFSRCMSALSPFEVMKAIADNGD